MDSEERKRYVNELIKATEPTLDKLMGIIPTHVDEVPKAYEEGMKALEEVKQRFCPDFDYIGSTCEAPEDDTRTLDAIKGNSLIYRVIRISDEKVIRDTIHNLENELLFVSNHNGTIKELRQKGYTWEEIFPAAVEACSRVEPINKNYE